MVAGRSCRARRGTPSTIGCRRCWSRPGSTASPRGSARATTPRGGAGRRCRRAATSACIWSATSKGSTASAAWSGAAPTACRCASSCGSARREPVPDHSWLSKTRARLPLEVHEAVFTWVLQRLAEHGLIKGERIGVDASTMEANAALRAIVRRDSGEGYREMLSAHGQGERHRDADGRGPDPAGPQAQGQAAVQRGLGRARPTRRPRSPS